MNFSPRHFSQRLHQRQTSGGFTLIETLVAISILMVGLSAAFSVVQLGLSSSAAVKDRITSIFLAQEAMEAVRNIKDSNLLAENLNAQDPVTYTANPDWLAGIADVSSGACLSTGAGCDYNMPDFTTLVPCSSGNSFCTLNIDGNGVYSHKTGAGFTPSRFSRTIKVLDVSPGSQPGQKEARVQVTISWPNHNFVVTENLTNWFAP